MQFDAYTIAFCLRNVADWEQGAARSLARAAARRAVPVPGILPVAVPALAKAYDLYSFKVLPWLGEQVAGDRGSYQYLVESIRRSRTRRRSPA